MCIRAGAVAQAALIRKVRGKHGNVSFVDISKTRVPEKGIGRSSVVNDLLRGDIKIAEAME